MIENIQEFNRTCNLLKFDQIYSSYNRWQHRICTLSVQLYSDVTSVNSVFVSDQIINDSDSFRIKCLSYSKISAIVCVFTLS